MRSAIEIFISLEKWLFFPQKVLHKVPGSFAGADRKKMRVSDFPVLLVLSLNSTFFRGSNASCGHGNNTTLCSDSSAILVL